MWRSRKRQSPERRKSSPNQRAGPRTGSKGKGDYRPFARVRCGGKEDALELYSCGCGGESPQKDSRASGRRNAGGSGGCCRKSSERSCCKSCADETCGGANASCTGCSSCSETCCACGGSSSCGCSSRCAETCCTSYCCDSCGTTCGTRCCAEASCCASGSCGNATRCGETGYACRGNADCACSGDTFTSTNSGNATGKYACGCAARFCACATGNSSATGAASWGTRSTTFCNTRGADASWSYGRASGCAGKCTTGGIRCASTNADGWKSWTVADWQSWSSAGNFAA